MSKPFMCPVCKGVGSFASWILNPATNVITNTCFACKGTGIVWSVDLTPENTEKTKAMLEALKKIVEKCDTREMISISHYHVLNISEIAQAAINAAEGEEKK